MPWWERLVRDTLYILLGLPLATASFAVLVTGWSAAFSLLVVFLIGVPVAIVTLQAGRLFAIVERYRLTARGDTIPTASYRRVTGRGWKGWLEPFRDPQTWLDTVHGLIAFPVSIATWVATVTWYATAIVGLTYPAWSWSIDDEANRTIAQDLNWNAPWGDEIVMVGVGLVALITLYPIVRLLAEIQAGVARALLSNQQIVALQQRVDELTRTRSGAVEVEAEALRRIERDLHDGPQQRLVRLSMDLGSAERRIDDDPAAAKALVRDARALTQETLDELRALSRGIAPPILLDRGLEAAVAAAAARCPVPVDLRVRLNGIAMSAAVERAAYFVVTEALTNVAKHAQATAVDVSLFADEDSLHVVIKDDGVGGADAGRGTGLRGLSDRVAALDGTLSVGSPEGGPTIVAVDIPCASS
jgi:signal transduction histidine kinase